MKSHSGGIVVVATVNASDRKRTAHVYKRRKSLILHTVEFDNKNLATRTGIPSIASLAPAPLAPLAP